MTKTDWFLAMVELGLLLAGAFGIITFAMDMLGV